MLVLKDISKNYYIKNERIDALKNINLNIKEGEFVAIIGQSGSGKSTLLNILGCLDRQSSGDYYIGGKNVSKLSSYSLSRLRAKEIGFVFQGFNLLDSLTAIENTELPLLYRGISKSRRNQLARKVLCAVGMEERLNHLPRELSGGQMQRVAVARALIGQPNIILADEPTGNLDPKTAWEIMSLLNDINRRGTTVVVATHAKDIVDEMQKRVITIENGVVCSDIKKGVYINDRKYN